MKPASGSVKYLSGHLLFHNTGMYSDNTHGTVANVQYYCSRYFAVLSQWKTFCNSHQPWYRSLLSVSIRPILPSGEKLQKQIKYPFICHIGVIFKSINQLLINNY